jgi:hypothetical protein
VGQDPFSVFLQTKRCNKEVQQRGATKRCNKEDETKMFLSYNWVELFVTFCTIGWKFAQFDGIVTQLGGRGVNEK